MSFKILAKVKFNDGIAIVIDKYPELVYQRIGSGVIYGTDGVFYSCYRHEIPHGRFKAFAGREFTLTMQDGEKVLCNGQWWDAGRDIVEEHLNIKLCSATIETAERLKKCYVFTGISADSNKMDALLSDYANLPVYPYYDYEKILKYDDMRLDFYRRLMRIEKAKKNLIIKVKELHKELIETR